MKINTKQTFKTFNNEVIKNGSKNFTFGEALAHILIESKVGGKMKMFALAEKFHSSKGNVELDEADVSLVRDAVESTGLYNNLINGLILKALKSE